ncbi:MAG: hypothetical protein U9N73_09285, partial [Candidatus Auribacterota bacterium]|nr:hypothetical protein [Candidatus Auribacterota bacterium]
LLLAIDQLNTFYQTLSRNNLNPDSLLYTVREPVITVTERSIDISRLILLVILAWIIAEGLIVAGIWWKSILPPELDQL